MATYLQIVNAVLARLRESSVPTVSATPYSKLIGKFVNDAKMKVENAWNWDSMSQTLPLTTSAGVSTYTLVGSGLRPKGISVNDTTNKYTLGNAPIKWILDQQQLTTVQNGLSSHYAWKGNTGGDSRVELFPTPNGAYVLKFNLYIPQATLSADATEVTVSGDLVELAAYARALSERGEDGGTMSSDAYAVFTNLMADEIALESSRFIETSVWVAV